MKSINPSNGKLLREFAGHTDADVERILVRASTTQREWRKRTFSERALRMRNIADLLEREKHDLGKLMTLEMGKPIAAAIAEAEKCATGCRYYADKAEAFLADRPAGIDGANAFVRFEPLGVVLAIMPWNFPFWQVFRFAAPTLMAGNVAVLKHASNVPQCALAIEDLFRRAGFEEGCFQTMLVGSDRVSKLIADPRIAAVTLTGSEHAGSAVAAEAARHIKKAVLELGGSDPFIIMPSADIDRAIQTAVTARTINNGQSCIAAKRFIIHASLRDTFEKEFVDRMAALRIGDPLDEHTQLGPLATRQIVDDLEDQVKRSIAAGARVLTGGKRADINGDGSGNYFLPTVLTDITESSPAYHEELFGPAASVFYVDNIDSAIRLANATSFGLGSAAWTNDTHEQRKFIDELQAGLVFINGMVASDPRLPFGGIKRSGYGRELADFGIHEFVNIKTAVVSQA